MKNPLTHNSQKRKFVDGELQEPEDIDVILKPNRQWRLHNVLVPLAVAIITALATLLATDTIQIYQTNEALVISIRNSKSLIQPSSTAIAHNSPSKECIVYLSEDIVQISGLRQLTIPAAVLTGTDPLPSVFALDGFSLNLPNGQLDWSVGMTTSVMLGFYYRSSDGKNEGFSTLTDGTRWHSNLRRSDCPDALISPT